MSFDALPPELVERVVVLLPLYDICSIRLVNRALESKATQDYFKATFRTKRVELTGSALSKFASAARSGGLCYLLRDLTLVAPVYNTLELEARLQDKATDAVEVDEHGSFSEVIDRDLTDEDLECTRADLEVLKQRKCGQAELQAGLDVTLLRQVFASLSSQTTLHSLSAEVAVYRDDAITPLWPLYGGSWKFIWAAASHLSQAIFASLGGLDVQSLNLFNSDRMLRCGVPCNELSKINIASAPPQHTFQSLSLSISDKIIDRSDQDATRTEDNREYWDPNQREVNRSDEALLEESNDTGNFTGLAHLLRQCSGLQELNLKHYSLAYVNPKINELHSRGILRSLGTGDFSRLPKLTLQGFTTTEDQLMGILRHLPALRDLSLHRIRLVQGGFQAILDYLTLENETIADLYLAGLLEPKIVLFTAPWVREGGYPGSQARWQRGQVSSSKLTYTLNQGRTLDTPAVRSWRQDLRNRYGPPKYGQPSCVKDVLKPEEGWRVN